MAETRRSFLKWAAGITGVTALATALPGLMRANVVHAGTVERLTLSDEEWRKRLSPAAYRVLRKEATERPWSSPLNKETRAGTYHCAGCDLALFSSETKYESGTGWPSFWKPIADGHLGTKTDWLIGYPRTEYHCARCGGHQGHVFEDGPPPTGLRYCNNGLALTFRPTSTAS